MLSSQLRRAKSTVNSAEPRLTVSTLVFRHNLLGWLYMLPVAPLHRIIVRATLARGIARGVAR